MDICIVCLSCNKEDISRIYLDTAEAQNRNIQYIIEKHLCWWYLRPSLQKDETWICLECWEQLLTFHNFYLKIEKLHTQYEIVNLGNSGKCVVVNEKQSNTFKEDDFLDQVEYEVSIVAIDSDNEIEIFEPLESQDEARSDQKYTIEINDNTICERNEKSTLKQKLKKRKSETTIIKRSKSLKIRQPRGKNHIQKQESRKENDIFLSQNKFKFMCDICSVHLNNFGQLKLHYRAEHKLRAYAKCCRKKFYERSTLVDHLMLHQNPSYFKCTFCDKCLANRRYFEKHLQSHQKLKKKLLDKPFCCAKCNKSFSMKIVYNRHLLTHVPNAEKKFLCLKCDKKFASPSVLNQHTALVHLNKYAKVCDICGQSFRHREYYMRHMAVHKGIPIIKFPCDLCETKLSSKYALNHHKKLKHTAENLKEQMCPYCEKISPNMYSHLMHIRNAHETDRKHACQMCDKKFKRPYQLRDHLSSHTGESLHKCPYCEKALSTSGNLRKHCKKFHVRQYEKDSLNSQPENSSEKQQDKSSSINLEQREFIKNNIIIK